jgi:hypothetical protein
MKMRMIKLKPEFIVEVLQGNAASFASNLPDDVELLDIKYDLFSKQVMAIVRSDSFEDVAESYPIPEFNLTHTARAKAESKPAASKPEAKPIDAKPAQRSDGTSAVEEEFSPEQRELLSFTVDGDYVIVKPIQYLKAEWNEINDVVRSLGGKWVKGDFSSYWVIPMEQS